ncbi:hypothetical protein ACFVYE_21860 [Streptomyces sp. NPDC058239]|uniref:hypothetical protein n=1 Tax=unclassified Streptomyces TaxID=2593676 RepID=UPI00365A8E48
MRASSDVEPRGSPARSSTGSQGLKGGRPYAYGAAVAPAGDHAADDEKAELMRRCA